jgi:Zn-dependent peptidase ImmA (M78 family)
MARIAINRDLLIWARERSGLSEKSLERRFPKLHQWLEGSVQPTMRQIEQFAAKTRTPVGYFFLSEPPEEKLPIPHFRTIAERQVQSPSPELLDTVYTMQQRQAWMREFLIEQGQHPLPFFGSASLDDDPGNIANDIKRVLDISNEWAAHHSTWENALRHLRNVIEESGILVVANGIVGNNTHRKLNVGEFRGFVLADEYAPLIFVNASDSKAAQMFTLAHEIAHIWFGSSAAFDLRQLQPADDPTEQVCNKVAAEFLVPAEQMREAWQTARSEDEPFQIIARQFKVSKLVAARRALDLALIGRDEFYEFYREYLDDEWRSKQKNIDRGEFYASQNLRVGRRFADAVFRAVKESRLSYYDAYKLTGLYGNTFDQYLQKLYGETAA